LLFLTINSFIKVYYYYSLAVGLTHLRLTKYRWNRASDTLPGLVFRAFS